MLFLLIVLLLLVCFMLGGVYVLNSVYGLNRVPSFSLGIKGSTTYGVSG